MEFEAKVWRAAHDSNEDAQVQSLVTSIPARDATDGDWTAWNERRNALYVSCVGTVTSADRFAVLSNVPWMLWVEECQ